MFKYAVNSNTVRKSLSSAEIVKLAADAGLDGIEWGLPTLDKAAQEIREMAALTADHGLKVVGYINGGKLWKRDDMKRWAEVVASVGGQSLRVAHPWIAWDFNESLHQRASYQEIFNLAHDGLAYLAELGRQYGVRFLMELHCSALTASALSAIRLLEGCDPKYFGVIYDPANTLIEGSMRPRSETEVLGDYLAYVHVKNVAWEFTGEFLEGPVRRARWAFKRCTPAGGVLDWLEVCFALKLVRFDGWLSFEEFFDTGDPAPKLRDALAFLKECEAAAPSAPEPPFTTFND